LFERWNGYRNPSISDNHLDLNQRAISLLFNTTEQYLMTLLEIVLTVITIAILFGFFHWADSRGQDESQDKE